MKMVTLEWSGPSTSPGVLTSRGRLGHTDTHRRGPSDDRDGDGRGEDAEASGAGRGVHPELGGGGPAPPIA